MARMEYPEQYQAMKREYLTKAVAYYPVFTGITKSVKASLMLSQLCYWLGSSSARERGGWIWKTVAEMKSETGLSKREQETARKKLIELGLIEARLKSIPRRWWYRVNLSQLYWAVRDVCEVHDRGLDAPDEMPAETVDHREEIVQQCIEGLARHWDGNASAIQ